MKECVLLRETFGNDLVIYMISRELPGPTKNYKFQTFHKIIVVY